MHKTIIGSFVVFAIIFIVGCSEYQEAYDDTFRFSFKKSFIASCAKSGGPKDVCACIADDLLATYTSKELDDQAKMEKHVKDISIKKCQP